MPNDFLFVNHTASDKLTSEAKSSAQAEILSHVQSRRYRRAKWSHFTSTLRATEQHNRQPGLEDDTPAQRDDGQQSRMVAHYPSNNSTDPFRSTTAHTDINDHRLLRCTIDIAARPNFLAEAFAPVLVTKNRRWCRHDGTFAQRLQRCVHDETLMYASLAYGSCFLSWTLNQREGEQSPEYFLNKATSSLRHRLAAEDAVIDAWTLIAIYSLAITQHWNGSPELWSGDEERRTTATNLNEEFRQASETHLRALVRFVDEAGGWSAFDPYILDSAILADKFLAISHSHAAIIPLTWDPGELPAQRLPQSAGGRPSSSWSMGATLVSACGNEELRQAVGDIVSYISVAGTLWAQPHVEAQDEAWLFRRLQAIICRVLNLSYSTISVHDRCLSLAILVFVVSSASGTGPQGGARHAAGQLKTTLEHHIQELQYGIEEDTLRWCYYVGAMTGGHSEVRQWFLKGILQRELTACSEEGLIVLFQGHLLAPGRTNARLKNLLRELNDMKGGASEA